MIAQNSIGNRLYTLISSDPVLVNSKYRVTLGDPLYPDKIQGPMATIQPGKFSTKPYIIGFQQSGSYLGTVQFHIFHSDMISNSVGALFLRLMRFEDRISTMISSNLQLDGLVDTLESIETDWAQYDPFSTDVAQIRVITLNYTARG